jgi:NADPH2:quinone reductase
MKAIRVHNFGSPDVMKLEEVPELKAGQRQVVIRVKAVGVNPVDTYIRSGSYGRMATLPYTPGADAAGSVEAVGPQVTRFKVGDRVYTAGTLTGSYAEQTLCDEMRIHPLPAHVSFAQGAAMGVPYGTAYRALFQRAQGLPGETVLIHGASGGVGTAAVQLARARGMRIIGTAGTPKGRDLVAQQGAHHVLDHRSADYLDQVMKLTEGKGVDIILEMLANVNLGRDLRVLALHGRVVVIGSRGTVEIDPRDTMGRDADIRGMSLFNVTPEDLSVIHAALVAGLEDDTLKPVIGKEFPLKEAAQAHELIMQPGSYGKIVLIP